MFRKILLPVDGNRAEAAGRYAEQIASAERAELYVLRVVKDSRQSDRDNWPPVGCDRAVSILPGGSILRGRPAEMIVAYADHIEADLILMSTRGYGQLGQLLFGSTSMDVIRTTKRAVWVAKKPLLKVERPPCCRRIVCGIDRTSEGQAVLGYAGRAAAAWGADLVIVHAIPGLGDAVMARYGLDETDDIEMLPKAACRSIRSMAAHLEFPFEVDVRIGDTADCLSRAVKKWRADLIIVGRGKRTNPWSVGANLGRIIARSTCPVVTYRPGQLRAAAWGGHRTTYAHHLEQPGYRSRVAS